MDRLQGASSFTHPPLLEHQFDEMVNGVLMMHLRFTTEHDFHFLGCVEKNIFVKWQLLQATTSVFQLTKCWRSFASIIHRSTNAAQFVWPLDEAKDCTYELFIQTLRCTAVSIAENREHITKACFYQGNIQPCKDSDNILLIVCLKLCIIMLQNL